MSNTDITALAELKQALQNLDTLYKGNYESPEATLALTKTLQSFNITIKDWNMLLLHINNHRSALDGFMEILPNVVTVFEETINNLKGKVDKLESTGTYVYTHNGSTQGQNIYTPYLVNNAIVQRDSNGEINVPTTPSDDSKATSKSYVDSELSSGLSTKVSVTNIKTINQQSLLGSGNIDILPTFSIDSRGHLIVTY